MSETPPEFDLKFLPDWLKEGPASKDYSNYEGDTGGGRRDFSDRRGQGRPGGGNRDDRRGPRPSRPPGGGAGPGARPGGPPRTGPGAGPRRSGPGGPGGPGGDRRGGPPQRRYEDRPPQQPAAPPVARAEVRIEFLPEAVGASNIAKQIRQSGRAYPLFGTGRLFLERPERHRVRITSMDPSIPLHQVGDGPVSFDRAAVERNAFRFAQNEYYKEEVQEGEPIKGNFTKIARSRTTGVLFGPTSYHSYQTALRRLYDERFVRRMSFQEFVQSDVEIVSDEQTVNEWKERARSSTTYTTLKEAEPIVFKSLMDAEQHFRKHYLPTLVKTAVTLECNGQASRALPDRNVSATVREMWEKERAFPAGLVNYLRPYLLDAGLHFFKHRKRILFISAIKPARHVSGQAISGSVEAILNAIDGSAKCSRRDLAKKLLGENHDAPEVAEQKAALAKDLHYLIHSGHVIEFHDATLDLPYVPGQQPQPTKGGTAPAAKGAPAPEAAVAVAAGALAVDKAAEAAAVSETASATDTAPEPTPEAIAEPAPTPVEPEAQPEAPSSEIANEAPAYEPQADAPVAPAENFASAPETNDAPAPYVAPVSDAAYTEQQSYAPAPEPVYDAPVQYDAPAPEPAHYAPVYEQPQQTYIQPAPVEYYAPAPEPIYNAPLQYDAPAPAPEPTNYTPVYEQPQQTYIQPAPVEYYAPAPQPIYDAPMQYDAPAPAPEPTNYTPVYEQPQQAYIQPAPVEYYAPPQPIYDAPMQYDAPAPVYEQPQQTYIQPAPVEYYAPAPQPIYDAPMQYDAPAPAPDPTNYTPVYEQPQQIYIQPAPVEYYAPAPAPEPASYTQGYEPQQQVYIPPAPAPEYTNDPQQQN